MNDDLLDAAREFDTFFINKFPTISNPVKLISDFNTALNAYAQASTEDGEIVNSITVLLSNSALEAFAAADFQADYSSEENNAVIAEARQVVDGGGNLAGLRELVSKLIADLNAITRK